MKPRAFSLSLVDDELSVLHACGTCYLAAPLPGLVLKYLNPGIKILHFFEGFRPSILWFENRHKRVKVLDEPGSRAPRSLSFSL